MGIIDLVLPCRASEPRRKETSMDLGGHLGIQKLCVNTAVTAGEKKHLPKVPEQGWSGWPSTSFHRLAPTSFPVYPALTYQIISTPSEIHMKTYSSSKAGDNP